MKTTRIAKDKSEITAAPPAACSDEMAAVEMLEILRWGGSPRCPHCGAEQALMLRDRKTGERNRRFLWKCKGDGCGKQFTVRVGTVFEDSRIPLRHWCYAYWAACASKKGVSALQIKRMIGLSYKSALFMMHRIRWAMRDGLPEKLTGTVEADETFVGGKPRYPGTETRSQRMKKKSVVAVQVQRGGQARASHIAKVNGKNLKRVVMGNVDENVRLITDHEKAYPWFARGLPGGHEVVNHSKREYVRGDVYTNTAESFFALFKRGLIGTFHSMSPRHLHRYATEFEFRWNTRTLDDGQRVQKAVEMSSGKRLMYSEPRSAKAAYVEDSWWDRVIYRPGDPLPGKKDSR